MGVLAGLGTPILMDDAQGSAARTLKEALKALQYIDVRTYKDKALSNDRAQYANWLKILQDVAPDLFKIREQSNQLFLDTLEPGQKADILGEKLFEEARGGVPQDLQKVNPIIDQLIGRSKEVLDLGGNISPEMQNQLLSAGLAQGAQSGTGIDRQGPTGNYLAKLLGTTSEALRSSRGAEASGLAQDAQSLQSGVDVLRNNRLSILGGLTNTFNAINQSKANLAGAGQQYVLNNAPKAGLGGSDVLNIMEANRNQKNQANMNIAGINAQRDIQTGEMWSQLLTNSLNAAGILAGGVMGGMGVGAAGAGAGAGGAGGATGAAGAGGAGGMGGFSQFMGGGMGGAAGGGAAASAQGFNWGPLLQGLFTGSPTYTSQQPLYLPPRTR